MSGLAFSKSFTVRGKVESQDHTVISVLPPSVTPEELEFEELPQAATPVSIAAAATRAIIFLDAVNFIVLPSFKYGRPPTSTNIIGYESFIDPSDNHEDNTKVMFTQTNRQIVDFPVFL